MILIPLFLKTLLGTCLQGPSGPFYERKKCADTRYEQQGGGLGPEIWDRGCENLLRIHRSRGFWSFPFSNLAIFGLNWFLVEHLD